MYSHLEAEERRRQAEYGQRKHGNVEFANATDAQSHLAAEGQALRRLLPSGLPHSIQDLQGNIAFIPGIHGPALPDDTAS